MTSPCRPARLRFIVARGDARRGQGLVEFAILVPLFMVLLLGMLELGFAFNHQLTLQYATREGARIGADLVNGGGALGCAGSPNASTVDPIIIEAVDRILTSSGSPIALSQIGQIRIFQADSSGKDTLNKGDNWTYTATPYTLYDGTQVNFSPSTSTWTACNRSNLQGHTYANAVDSIGVSLTYTYKLTTPLAGAMKLIGGSQAATISMTDATVMQFSPTSN